MNMILLVFIAIGLFILVVCRTSKKNISATMAVDVSTLKTLKIGEQEWMVENLNVDHFRNGDIIPEAKTNEEWIKAGEEERPAWCYYDNNSSNGEKYGKLYNFYAVIDSRSLAPNGWHVSTDAEWTVLTDIRDAGHGGAGVGTALKATSGWDFLSKIGWDDYGFSGLPGGFRFSNGCFDGVGDTGGWWSSSQSSPFPSDAWYRNVYYYDGLVISYHISEGLGCSVRCLRD